MMTNENSTPAIVADIDRMIGLRMAAFRVMRGMTRDALAIAAHMPVDRIARVERANAKLRASELVLAARALGITSAVLTGEEAFSEAKGGAG